MTLSKDLPRKGRPEKPPPRFPWLVPVFVTVAIVVLVGAAIAIALLGIPLF